MAHRLSENVRSIVRATAPALQQHGVAITTRMYERLFVDPAVRAMFDAAAQESGAQPRRLAAAILGYAQNIDRLEALSGAVDRMVARHVATGVRADHYPLVAAALLPAIRDVLGAAATDEVLAAWGEAYWLLADMLIVAEGARYDARDEAA
jgi:hemoglobin-like flavoprotein